MYPSPVLLTWSQDWTLILIAPGKRVGLALIWPILVGRAINNMNEWIQLYLTLYKIYHPPSGNHAPDLSQPMWSSFAGASKVLAEVLLNQLIAHLMSKTEIWPLLYYVDLNKTFNWHSLERGSVENMAKYSCLRKFFCHHTTVPVCQFPRS